MRTIHATNLVSGFVLLHLIKKRGGVVDDHKIKNICIFDFLQIVILCNVFWSCFPKAFFFYSALLVVTVSNEKQTVVMPSLTKVKS